MSTPDAESFMLIRGKSFVAQDKKIETIVKHTAKSDTQVGEDGLGDWDSFQIDWKRGKEHMVYDD